MRKMRKMRKSLPALSPVLQRQVQEGEFGLVQRAELDWLLSAEFSVV